MLKQLFPRPFLSFLHEPFSILYLISSHSHSDFIVFAKLQNLPEKVPLFVVKFI